MAAEQPLNVIIVEDEALLVMDLEGIVEDAGHRVIAEAACLQDMRSIPADARPDIAFVDLHLAEGSSGLDVCAYIQVRWAAAMIVFVTANPAELPEDFAGAHGVIAKPFSRSGLIKAMRYLHEGLRNPPPVSSLPASFVVSKILAGRWR